VNLRAYRRFVTVARQFLPLMLAYARDRHRFLLFGRSRQVSAAERKRRAARLLDSLLTLGPTFIKLGQLLSTRPDVLPPEYIEELSKLQDEVPPAPWEEAKAVIETELGPVEDRFEHFDTESISGASLGQVYYAETRDGAVAVKVRRPGVEDLVEADLRVIRWSLPIIMRFVDDARSFSLETLADEFDRVIRQEMDYEREARMLKEIRQNFESDERVRIPTVDDDLSTGRVLTMEYVEGTKISNVHELDRLNVDRTAIAETLQRVYLQMIVQDGVFHADPHPGNLAVQPDGTVVFYDFGMSGYVEPYVQEKIIDFYIAVANQDTDAILDTLIEMGTLSPDADRQVMGEVMELAIADARGEDIEQYRIQQIVQQVEDTIYEFPLRLPSNLALVLRVATVVEGVCVTLDPDFDFIEVATGYLRDQGYLEAGVRQFLTERRDELTEATKSAVRTPPKLERVLDRIDRDDLRVKADVADPDDHLYVLAKRVVAGMVVAAGIVSTAVLYASAGQQAATVGGAGTLLATVVLYLTFRRRTGIRTEPQFTRQNLRQQDHDLDGEGSSVGGVDVGTTGFGDGVAQTQSDEESDRGANNDDSIDVTGPDGGGDSIDVAGPDGGGDGIDVAGPDDGGDSIDVAGPDDEDAGDDTAGDAGPDHDGGRG
jgi:predicted unusual protein kinase regulating ubiquinone biosynthesis (AarF/ABC1/UbiB family)